MDRWVPERLTLTNVVAIATGSAHSIVLDSSHQVWVFGSNAVGQLGLDALVTSQSLPFSLYIISETIKIDAGEDHSIFLASNGTLYATGSNSFGQLAINDTLNRFGSSKVATGVSTIAVGAFNTYFIQNTTCFGYYPNDAAVCTGNGTCTFMDTCACVSGYTGDKCQSPICFGKAANDPNVCSRLGTCVLPDTCQCNSSSGIECSYSEFRWNSSMSGNWSNPLNWLYRSQNALVQAPRAPYTGDSVYFDLAGTYSVGLDTSLTITYVVAGAGDSFPTLTVMDGVSIIFKDIELNKNAILVTKSGVTLNFDKTLLLGSLQFASSSGITFNYPTKVYGPLSYEPSTTILFKNTTEIYSNSIINTKGLTFQSPLVLSGNLELLVDQFTQITVPLVFSENSSITVVKGSTLETSSEVNVTSGAIFKGSGNWNVNADMNFLAPGIVMNMTVIFSSNVNILADAVSLLGGSSYLTTSKLNLQKNLTLGGVSFIFTSNITGQATLTSNLESTLNLEAISTVPFRVNALGTLKIKQATTFANDLITSGPIDVVQPMNVNGYWNHNGVATGITGSGLITLQSGASAVISGTQQISPPFVQNSAPLTIHSGFVTMSGAVNTSNTITIPTGAGLILQGVVISQDTGFAGKGQLTLDTASDWKLLGGHNTISNPVKILKTVSFGMMSTQFLDVVEFGANAHVISPNTVQFVEKVFINTTTPIVGAGSWIAEKAVEFYTSGVNVSVALQLNGPTVMSASTIYFNHNISLSSSASIATTSSSMLVFQKSLAILTNTNSITGAGRIVTNKDFSLSGSSCTLDAYFTLNGNTTFGGASYTFPRNVEVATSSILINSGSVLTFNSNFTVQATATSFLGTGKFVFTSTSFAKFVGSTNLPFELNIQGVLDVQGDSSFSGPIDMTGRLLIPNSLVIDNRFDAITTSNSIMGGGLLTLAKNSYTNLNSTQLTSIDVQLVSSGNLTLLTGSFEFLRQFNNTNNIFTNNADVVFKNDFYTSNTVMRGIGLITLQPTSKWDLSGAGVSISNPIKVFTSLLVQTGFWTFESPLDFGPSSNLFLNAGTTITSNAKITLNTTNPVTGTGQIITNGPIDFNTITVNFTTPLIWKGTVTFPVGTYEFKEDVTMTSTASVVTTPNTNLNFVKSFIVDTNTNSFIGGGKVIIQKLMTATGANSNFDVRFVVHGNLSLSAHTFAFARSFDVSNTGILIMSSSTINVNSNFTVDGTQNTFLGTGVMNLNSGSHTKLSGASKIPYQVNGKAPIDFLGTHIVQGVSDFTSAAFLNIPSGASAEFIASTTMATNPSSLKGSGKLLITAPGSLSLTGGSNVDVQMIVNADMSLNGQYTFARTIEVTNGTFTIPSGSFADFASVFNYTSTTGQILGTGTLKLGSTARFSSTSCSVDVDVVSNSNTVFTGTYDVKRTFTAAVGSSLTIPTGSTVNLFANSTINATPTNLIGSGNLNLLPSGTLNIYGNLTTSWTVTSFGTILIFNGDSTWKSAVFLKSLSTLLLPLQSQATFENKFEIDTNVVNVVQGAGKVNVLASGSFAFASNVSSIFTPQFYTYATTVINSGSLQMNNYVLIATTARLNITQSAFLRITTVCDMFTTTGGINGEGSLVNTRGAKINWSSNTLTMNVIINSSSNMTFITGKYNFMRSVQSIDSYITVTYPAEILFDSTTLFNTTYVSGNGLLSLTTMGQISWYGGTIVNANININNLMSFYPGNYFFNANSTLTPTSKLIVETGSYVEFTGDTNFQTNPSQISGGGVIKLSKSSSLVLSGTVSLINVTFTAFSNVTFLTGKFTFLQYASFGPNTVVDVRPNSTIEIQNNCDIFQADFIGGGSMIIGQNGKVNWNAGKTLVDVDFTSNGQINYLTGNYQFTRNATFANAQTTIADAIRIDYTQKFSSSSSTFSGRGAITLQSGSSMVLAGSNRFDVDVKVLTPIMVSTGTNTFNGNLELTSTSTLDLATSSLIMNNITTFRTVPNMFTGTGAMTFGVNAIVDIQGTSLNVPYIFTAKGNMTLTGAYTFQSPVTFTTTSLTRIPQGSILNFDSQVFLNTNNNNLVGGGVWNVAQTGNVTVSGIVGVLGVAINTLGPIKVLDGYQSLLLPVNFNGASSMTIQTGATVQFDSQVKFTSSGLLNGGGVFKLSSTSDMVFNTTLLDIDVVYHTDSQTQFVKGAYKLLKPARFNPTTTIMIDESSTLQVQNVVEIHSNQNAFNGGGIIKNVVGGQIFFSGGPTQMNIFVDSIAPLNFINGSYTFNKNVNLRDSTTTIQVPAQVIINTQFLVANASIVGSGTLDVTSISQVSANLGYIMDVHFTSHANMTYTNGRFVHSALFQVSNVSTQFIDATATLEFRSVTNFNTSQNSLRGTGTIVTTPTSLVTFTAEVIDLYLSFDSQGTTRYTSGIYNFYAPIALSTSPVRVDLDVIIIINSPMTSTNVPQINGGGTVRVIEPNMVNWTTSATTTLAIKLESNGIMNFVSGSFVLTARPVSFGPLSQNLLSNAVTLTLDTPLTIQANSSSLFGGGLIIFTPLGVVTWNGQGSNIDVVFTSNSLVKFDSGAYRMTRPFQVTATGKVEIAAGATLQLEAVSTVFGSKDSFIGSGTLIVGPTATLQFRDGMCEVQTPVKTFSSIRFTNGKYYFKNTFEMMSNAQNNIDLDGEVYTEAPLTVNVDQRAAFTGKGHFIVRSTLDYQSGDIVGPQFTIASTAVANMVAKTKPIVLDQTTFQVDGKMNFDTTQLIFRFTNFTIGATGVFTHTFGTITNGPAVPMGSGDLVYDLNDGSKISNIGIMELKPKNETEIVLGLPVRNAGTINLYGGRLRLSPEFLALPFSTLNILNANVTVPGTMMVTDGMFRVSGVIECEHLNISTNTGIIRMNEPGTLKVIGNVHLLKSTTLVITIYGTESFDRLDITGILIMECFVYIKLGPSYLPLVGDLIPAFVTFRVASITSPVNLIGASYRNGQIIKGDSSADLTVVTSIGSVGNLNYTCHYMGNARIVEYNRFDLTNTISVTITTPKPSGDQWIGFGIGPFENFTNALYVVSSPNQTFQITDKKLLGLLELDTFLDIGANQINTLFNIGPLYKSMSIFLPLNWFQQQEYIYFYEWNVTGPIDPSVPLPEPTYKEVIRYNMLKDREIACTNFLAPTRLEVYSQAATGTMLSLYLVLFILCVIMSRWQPLKSRGISPFLTLFFIFANLLLEIRNYFYITNTQQTLCLYYSYGVYPLMQVCYIMILLYTVRYYSIINLNERKNDLSALDTDAKSQKNEEAASQNVNIRRLNSAAIYVLKYMSTAWFPLLLLIIYSVLLVLLFTIIMAADSFECKFETLINIRLANTIILIIVSLLIIAVIIGDIIANWKTTLKKCRWDIFIFRKDPFFFRVQTAVFLPFMLYTLIAEVWMFFSSFTFYQVVVNNQTTIILNTIAFAILLVLDVLFPIVATIITQIVYFIRKRLAPPSDTVFSMFENPDLEAILVRFAQKEFSVENVLSYRDILTYKQHKTKEAAMKVYNDYLRGQDSLMELNLPGRVTKDVKERIDNGLFTDDLFDKVEGGIAVNLSDTLSRIIFFPDYIIYKNNTKVKATMLENLGL